MIRFTLQDQQEMAELERLKKELGERQKVEEEQVEADKISLPKFVTPETIAKQRRFLKIKEAATSKALNTTKRDIDAIKSKITNLNEKIIQNDIYIKEYEDRTKLLEETQKKINELTQKNIDGNNIITKLRRALGFEGEFDGDINEQITNLEIEIRNIIERINKGEERINSIFNTLNIPIDNRQEIIKNLISSNKQALDILSAEPKVNKPIKEVIKYIDKPSENGAALISKLIKLETVFQTSDERDLIGNLDELEKQLNDINTMLKAQRDKDIEAQILVIREINEGKQNIKDKRVTLYKEQQRCDPQHLLNKLKIQEQSVMSDIAKLKQEEADPTQLLKDALDNNQRIIGENTVQLASKEIDFQNKKSEIQKKKESRIWNTLKNPREIRNLLTNTEEEKAKKAAELIILNGELSSLSQEIKTLTETNNILKSVNAQTQAKINQLNSTKLSDQINRNAEREIINEKIQDKNIQLKAIQLQIRETSDKVKEVNDYMDLAKKTNLNEKEQLKLKPFLNDVHQDLVKYQREWFKQLKPILDQFEKLYKNTVLDEYELLGRIELRNYITKNENEYIKSGDAILKYLGKIIKNTEFMNQLTPTQKTLLQKVSEMMVVTEQTCTEGIQGKILELNHPQSKSLRQSMIDKSNKKLDKEKRDNNDMEKNANRNLEDIKDIFDDAQEHINHFYNKGMTNAKLSALQKITNYEPNQLNLNNKLQATRDKLENWEKYKIALNKNSDLNKLKAYKAEHEKAHMDEMSKYNEIVITKNQHKLNLATAKEGLISLEAREIEILSAQKNHKQENENLNTMQNHLEGSTDVDVPNLTAFVNNSTENTNKLRETALIELFTEPFLYTYFTELEKKPIKQIGDTPAWEAYRVSVLYEKLKAENIPNEEKAQIAYVAIQEILISLLGNNESGTKVLTTVLRAQISLLVKLYPSLDTTLHRIDRIDEFAKSKENLKTYEKINRTSASLVLFFDSKFEESAKKEGSKEEETMREGIKATKRAMSNMHEMYDKDRDRLQETFSQDLVEQYIIQKHGKVTSTNSKDISDIIPKVSAIHNLFDALNAEPSNKMSNASKAALAHKSLAKMQNYLKPQKRFGGYTSTTIQLCKKLQSDLEKQYPSLKGDNSTLEDKDFIKLREMEATFPWLPKDPIAEAKRKAAEHKRWQQEFELNKKLLVAEIDQRDKPEPIKSKPPIAPASKAHMGGNPKSPGSNNPEQDSRTGLNKGPPKKKDKLKK